MVSTAFGVNSYIKNLDTILSLTWKPSIFLSGALWSFKPSFYFPNWWSMALITCNFLKYGWFECLSWHGGCILLSLQTLIGIPSHQKGVPSYHKGIPPHLIGVPFNLIGVPSPQEGIPSHQKGTPPHLIGVPFHQKGVPSYQKGIPPQLIGVPFNLIGALLCWQGAVLC